ncbi:hypothetical protein C8J57DRAFT_1250238 [Mycena rebaudengoi]|nr:hypothetical protein C8J57DRAFT_1250238 [Mycena rebaudengoi]
MWDAACRLKDAGTPACVSQSSRCTNAPVARVATVLIRTKYELPESLRLAREKAWFINRWGKYKRCIAADLWLEQQNFWVKRVFIAGGSSVTIEYIISKGSASAEAFREVSHSIANYYPDRARHHKEVKFHEDVRSLIKDMVRLKAHKISPQGNFVPAPPKTSKKTSANSLPVTAELRSAIFDVIVEGAQEWQGTAFDSDEIPFSFDSYDDLHGDEHENTGLRAGALGGGDEFSTGVVGICPWSAAREGCEIEEGCVDP